MKKLLVLILCTGTSRSSHLATADDAIRLVDACVEGQKVALCKS